MSIGFYALGGLCLVYYLILIWYSKRLGSTFTWFWLVFGAFQFLLGFAVSYLPSWADCIIQTLMALAFVVFAALEVLILCAMLVVPPKELDYIIVLGAQIRGKRVTASLKRRLDKALHFLQEHEMTKCIVSGGQGKGEEIPEAEAMAEYLIACGISKERILLEAQSKTTFENLKFSKMMTEDMEGKRVGIATSNFHIYRSVKLAKHLGYKKVFPMPAGCNFIYFLNYMVREFFAVLLMVYRLKKNRA